MLDYVVMKLLYLSKVCILWLLTFESCPIIQIHNSASFELRNFVIRPPGSSAKSFPLATICFSTSCIQKPIYRHQAATLTETCVALGRTAFEFVVSTF